MAFLDNSGDIILDAVLTDTGRWRLAKGDGSFKIVKFALGDDEINYQLYRNSNHSSGAHASGSAYYDLEILQTPVLEAFTNNTSMMKSKLISIPQSNLLYLPVIKLNRNKNSWQTFDDNTKDYYITAVTDQTEVAFITKVGIGAATAHGVLNGYTAQGGNHIVLDQGLDTTDISYKSPIGDLIERHYIVEMDNRLGSLTTSNGTGIDYAFLDDDQIATYRLSLDTDNVVSVLESAKIGNSEGGGDGQSTIMGPRGTRLELFLKASTELQQSNFLFERFGSSASDAATSIAINGGSATHTENYINTTIRVTGATTGYRLDVPVRYVKCTTCTETSS